MNERIKELAVEAGIVSAEYNGFDPTGLTKAQRKFAELIITECTQLLFAESERLYAYSGECDIMSRSEEAEVCAEKCIDNILMIEQHFGVQE